MSSIHAMSDQEFSDWDSELGGDAETGRAWLEYLNPENEANYDDCAEPENLDGIPECCELWGLSSDMPHPEDIGFDPTTDCQNPF